MDLQGCYIAPLIMTAAQVDVAWRRQAAMEVRPLDFPPGRPFERNPIVNDLSKKEILVMRPASADSSSCSVVSRSRSASGITTLSKSSSAAALKNKARSQLSKAGASSVTSLGGRSQRSSVLMVQLEEERKRKIAAEAEILKVRAQLEGREPTPFPLNKMTAGK